MGYFKDRLTTTITAELKLWRFSIDGNHVTGTVKASFHPDYKEGEKYTLMNIKASAYPYTAQFGEAHMILKSPIGSYFRVNLSDHENQS